MRRNSCTHGSSNGSIRILTFIDVYGLSVGAGGEDANGIVEPNGDQLSAVRCIAEESWARGICGLVRNVSNITLPGD